MAKGLRNVAFLHNAALCLCLLAAGPVERSSALESLDRGMIAIRVDTKSVAIGWRILASDPANIAVNLYGRTPGQEGVLLNDRPIIKSTHFISRNYVDHSKAMLAAESGIEFAIASIYEFQGGALSAEELADMTYNPKPVYDPDVPLKLAQKPSFMSVV